MKKMKTILGILLLLMSINCDLIAQTTPSTSLPFNGKLYTTTADFYEGSLLSVNTNIPDQLQLDQPGRPLPYINIACSNSGTVVRINIETGAIVGEYLTYPAGKSGNPSRTTVDKEGNVWVTNRDEASISGGFAKGSVTRIGVVIGGTRCDASGNPDPGGQYLKPPFFYNTCIDRNGDGLIKTSFGLGNILPWSNPGGINNDGGVSSADDEAIITYTRVRATGARTVAIDNNNDLWVGGSSNRFHEKLRGSYIPLNGTPIAGSLFNEGCGGYGGFIDGNGVLWSSSGSGAGLLRFVPNSTFPPAGTATELNGVGNYGLGVDPITGEVWHTASEGNKIYKISSSGTLLGSYSHGWDAAQGCAVDAIGNVWVAHALFPTPSTTVGHLRTDGTFIGNVTLPNGGAGPTGVAVDANGKIWVACYNSSQAFRINPNAGPIVNGYPLGEVDLTVDLGAGANPYNYSDMTGYVVINATVPSGTWTVIHDGGTAGIKWGQMNWTDLVPAETSVEVSARASDQLLTLPAYDFVPVENGQSFCCAGVTGRYVEIRVKLSRQSTVNVSPILYDLSIQSCDIYPNIPPTIQCSRGCNGDTIKIAAGQTLQFNISAADADAAQVVNISAEGLPTNATMTPPLPATGNPTSTTFSWPTTFADLGVYNVTFAANDIYCYSAVCPTIINVVPCPSIRCSGAGISCLDSCNGRASVTILGDPINYTYTWNTTPPQTTPDISRLCPGTYKVVTYDGAACLDSCTVTIPNEPCTNFRTYTQGGYGATPKGKNVAAYLKSKFPSVFPTGLTIGCNNKLKLTTWQAVVDFLPSGSTAMALPTGTLTNPGQSYQNVLAGQLVAATLNVKFDSAFANFSPNPILLKDLVIAYGPFSGWTISRLLEEANRAIGGCGSVYSFSALNNALDLFNNNYNYNEFMNSPLNNRCFLSCPINPTSGSLRPSTSMTSPADEIDPENELLVYPNPANEKLNVKYTAAESMKVRIELLSNMGNRVREILNTSMKKGEETERIISTNQLTPGMYWIRVMDEYGSQLDIKKVIIQR